VLPRAALEAQDLRPELHISEKRLTQIHWQLCSRLQPFAPRSQLGTIGQKRPMGRLKADAQRWKQAEPKVSALV